MPFCHHDFYPSPHPLPHVATLGSSIDLPLSDSSTTLLYAARIAKTEAVRCILDCFSRGSYKELGLAHGKIAARDG